MTHMKFAHIYAMCHLLHKLMIGMNTFGRQVYIYIKIHKQTNKYIKKLRKRELTKTLNEHIQ